MPERRVRTETVKATDFRQRFSEVINKVARREVGRVVIEKGGIPVVAIVPTDDLAKLDRYDAERERRFRALWETGEAFEDVPIEEIEREVASAIEQVRVERKRQRHTSAR